MTCLSLLSSPPFLAYPCRVVANILKGPLVELAPRLAGYAAPGAALGLSGVLTTQAPAVTQAYAPFFENFEVAEEEGWAVITAVRRRP